MNSYPAFALLALAGTLAFAGCEREARRFQEPPRAAVASRNPPPQLQPAGETRSQPVRNTYEENAYAMAEGQRLFRWYNCNGCHANGGGGQGPALMDDVWIYGGEPADIYISIVEGRPNGMPSFGGRIIESEIWKIAAYVRSMSGLVRADAAPSRRDAIHVKEPENRQEAQQPKLSAPPPPS